MEIAEAKKALKQAAAALLVKKDKAEAEVAALDARIGELSDGLARAEAAGDADLLRDVQSALQEQQARAAVQRDLLAELTHSFEETKKELAAIDGLATSGERARLLGDIAQLTGSDPFATTPEARALENARDGIAELEARVEVQRELAAEQNQARDVERRLAALDREDRDAAARAELERLKAARRGQASAPEADDNAEDRASDAPPGRPKRTL